MTGLKTLKQDVSIVAATIAEDAAATDWLDGKRMTGLYVDVPASWDAADLTIEVSNDGATSLGKLRDPADGAVVRLVVNATTPKGRYVADLGKAWAALGSYFRVVSTNTASEADVNQTAARSLSLGLMA